MSFRFADLKKSVRRGREGHVIAPVRLEGRAAARQVEFVLAQFDAHLGRARRLLDPEALMDFLGDPRLGRGVMATLSQWYRIRPRTFDEVLAAAPGGVRRCRLAEHGITDPVELRAWLYAAANTAAHGYLDPDAEAFFWAAQSRALGLKREALERMILLDRPEEAILVRLGPRPEAEDVMAAYNARAHTTLLRSAEAVELRCAAPRRFLEEVAEAWAADLEVEWSVEGDRLQLRGKADAQGCWTRHGRRVEMLALELLALPDLAVREVSGTLRLPERTPRFTWKPETLAGLGAGTGGAWTGAAQAEVARLGAALRRERERSAPATRRPEGTRVPRHPTGWSVRRPQHLLAVSGGACLPHVELRRGDSSLYLRLGSEEPGGWLAPFAGKTPVAEVALPDGPDGPLLLSFPGQDPVEATPGDLLAAVGTWEKVPALLLAA